MKKEKRDKIIQRAIGIGIIVVLLLAAEGGFGFMWAALLFFLVIVFIALYKCWMYRDNVLDIMRQIETMIWGRPNDKHYSHIPKKKVKFVWRKKDESKKSPKAKKSS